MITRIKTFSGSIYDVRKDENDQWWLRGNVANSHSVAMDGQRWWKIDVPYPMPIIIGYRVILASKYAKDSKDNPLRIEGGGKITSEVVDLQGIPD